MFSCALFVRAAVSHSEGQEEYVVGAVLVVARECWAFSLMGHELYTFRIMVLCDLFRGENCYSDAFGVFHSVDYFKVCE